jgi:hypothetical protein
MGYISLPRMTGEIVLKQKTEIAINKNSKQPWIPRKERPWVFLALWISIALVITGLWQMTHITSDSFHTRSFESSFREYGSLAELTLYFVLALYVLKFLVHKRLADRWVSIKNGLIQLLRFVRKWHTPFAIFGIGLILVHAAGAVLYGIRPDFHNISGLLALFILLPVPVAGLFRYRMLDRKWHVRLALGFTVLFVIHAYF